ncbi:hypothetical protein D0Z03_001368 [Geotrichum reessii]|nr:hypothetical protein D0Z03_001368 [Galactomyces reessii]
MEADLIKPEQSVLPDPALGNASTPSFTPIAAPSDSTSVTAPHEPSDIVSPVVNEISNATSSPSISFSYLSRSTSITPINADSSVMTAPQTELTQPQQISEPIISSQLIQPVQPQEQSLAQAQAAAALEKKAAAALPAVRSSWVWNHFVQTPENPFRVQCQCPVPGDGPNSICGVILTRDKTGSTGSMCRHLNRVHQMTSNVKPTNVKKVKEDPESGAGSLGSPIGSKRTFSAMNGNSLSASANKKLADDSKFPTGQTPSKARTSNGSSSTSSSSHKKSSAQRTLSKEEIIARVIPYYIESGSPLDRSEYNLFKDFIASLDLHLTMPEIQSYNSFVALASRWHNEMKEGIKSELAKVKGQISLTCGVWKSWDNCGSWENKRRDRQFVIMAHFIDNNWTLKRVLLKIEPLRWYHDSVVKLIVNAIEEFNIKDKVFTVLTDEESNTSEKGLYKGLSKSLNVKSAGAGADGNGIFGSLVTDIYAIVDNFLYPDTSTTTNATKAGLKDIVKTIELISDDIESTQTKTEYFQKCQKEEPALVSLREPNDDNLYSKNVSNQTGWRLFFQLISNAVIRKESVEKYLKKYDDFSGSNDDDEEDEPEESILQLAEGTFGANEWLGLEILYEILKPIYTTLNDLESSAYNTAGVTSFAIESLIKTLKETFSSAKFRELLDKYEDRGIEEEIRLFVNNISNIYTSSPSSNNYSIFKCVQVLDPNFKRLFRHMTREEQADIRGKFKLDLANITRESRENDVEANGESSSQANGINGREEKSNEDIDRTPGFFQSLVNDEETVDSLTSELDEYVRMNTGQRLVDPYLWWAKNGDSFPQLNLIAKTYMAVPGWNDVLHDGKLMEESVVLLRARTGNQYKSFGKEMCLRYWIKNGYSNYCMIKCAV